MHTTDFFRWWRFIDSCKLIEGVYWNLVCFPAQLSSFTLLSWMHPNCQESCRVEEINRCVRQVEVSPCSSVKVDEITFHTVTFLWFLLVSNQDMIFLNTQVVCVTHFNFIDFAALFNIQHSSQEDTLTVHVKSIDSKHVCVSNFNRTYNCSVEFPCNYEVQKIVVAASF